MVSLRIQSAVNICRQDICRQTKFRLSDNYKLCGLVHGFPLTAPVVMDIPRVAPTRINPQQGDLRLPGSPSGRGAGGGARTRDRRVPADLRTDSLANEPPTPPSMSGFEALHQARAPVVGFEPATEGSLQISGRIHYPLCHRGPKAGFTVMMISGTGAAALCRAQILIAIYRIKG
ncbi:hypothetical protein PoB_006567300 [Plakobranchus ocellatus]|uniref:Uncharacterized protein n=1 Tax=Plakobranchus ocellatus TaxID=259542 RepID=A0AAV4D4W1_9GAST|nr:hypothetical protein PoB_006567300 [Plakobranchus ocellatus]